MNRNEILEAIKDDIIKYVKPSVSPYKSNIAEVKRGGHSQDEVVNRPFIGIAMDSETLEEEEFDTFAAAQKMLMPVYVYCYIDTNGYGNYDDMHQLIRDLEYFFKYDYSYKGYTSIKRITPIEAGVNAPSAFFSFELEIKYDNDI